MTDTVASVMAQSWLWDSQITNKKKSSVFIVSFCFWCENFLEIILLNGLYFSWWPDNGKWKWKEDFLSILAFSNIVFICIVNASHHLRSSTLNVIWEVLYEKCISKQILVSYDFLCQISAHLFLILSFMVLW